MSPQEQAFWDTKLLEARRSQLDTVRKSATAWASLLTAVLGVFGTAAFVTGLPGLDDFVDAWGTGLRMAVVVVAVLLLAAVISGGLASTSLPKTTSDMNSENLRDATKESARVALRRLRFSMISGALAAAVLIVGSIVVVFAPTEAPKPAAVLVVADGATLCGRLERDASGGLVVDGKAIPQDAVVTTVTRCP